MRTDTKLVQTRNSCLAPERVCNADQPYSRREAAEDPRPGVGDRPRLQYGCTPAWWQLWKGLHEVGVDLIVTPYRGRPIEAPWWRTEPNPCYREGEIFVSSRDAVARAMGDTHFRRDEEHPPDGTLDKLVRQAIWRWVTPRWRRHVERILVRERDVDAVVVFGVPMSHFRGLPEWLRERFSIPVVFYDGDVPMSLPEYGGMDTGFNNYHGADPGEYDLVVSNSEGGLGRLRELGARRAEAIFWGADPELFRPLPVEKTTDVYFYGYGEKFRAEWIEKHGRGAEPPSGGCRPLRSAATTFAATSGTRGTPATCRSTSSRTRSLPRASTSTSPGVRTRPCPRRQRRVPSSSRWRVRRSSRIRTPASSAGSSPAASSSSSTSADEAVSAYEELLGDSARAEELGRAARERALDEHTYVHRARRLLELLEVSVPTTPSASRHGT